MIASHRLSRHRVRFRWSLTVAALALAAATTQAQTPAPPGAVEVQVLLFSGRPDPTFVLTEAEADQIAALVQKAPEAPKRTGSVIPSVLGYRGILVKNVGKRAGLPAEIAIFNGSMQFGAGGDQRVDANRQIESTLLDLAMAKGVVPDTIVRRAKEGTAR